MKKLLFIICMALAIVACKAPSNTQANQQTQVVELTSNQSVPASSAQKMDAGAIIEAFGAQRNLPQVQGNGVVTKVLKDDTKGLKHQKFLLKVSDNITILIAHNIDLAPRVADINEDDVVEFKGEYIYTPKGGTVHWTHKDPRGHHAAGYLKHNGKTYE